MLLSSVIHLKALESGSIPQYMGAAIRSEFLTWMGISDAEEPHSADEPREETEMHGGNQLRPYTVSDLQGVSNAQKGFNRIEAGQRAWFRVTTLNEEQSQKFQNAVLPTVVDRVFQLDRVKFQVTNAAEAGKHPGARATSYQALVDKYLKSDSPVSDTLNIEFKSLTTFHAGDFYLPLPVPKLILRSWLMRWNRFSSAILPFEARDIREANFALSQHDIQTDTVEYRGISWIGFKGKCAFRIFAREAYWARLCNLLAEFSFYCGTGHKTTYGLGQTWRA
ncbi:MAG: CRISPR system precrRNA processing endoribonuclease RAMP protein Cas6 [Anaerolineae bacterium]|nr:CRISPR system precrRNA processing endoribonuclease RAMP protein Cas6 [Anaerolineae bacterium]MBL8105217.1 CRISPR system precrRNA processing endoribonuclease RAMP protein Cas6 [Anaerolineales bacterium]MCC7187860.1 CRISPR system precrRNA processing endoribonuclease RAMP protein Cas6 [Anaerolineales bacterium]